MIPTFVHSQMRARARLIIGRLVRDGVDLGDIDAVDVAADVDRIALDETGAPAVECSDAAYEAASLALADIAHR